jgi:hypothetical protein
MAKVLIIRKPDRTIHQVPIANKAILMSFNNRLPAGLKWSFEEMDEEAAKKLPFIDPHYVTAAEAVTKVKQLEAETSEKDTRIAELEAMLANLNNANLKPAETAVDVIAKINAATSTEEVKTILGSDDRKTVLDAAAKKIGTF